MPANAAAVYLTPPEVAHQLHVKPSKVITWIRSGRLRAVDLSDGPKRPRFRIKPADLDAFLATKEALPAPPVVRRRRRADAATIEFY
jgi:excisionase family DNA binding protein